MAKQELLESHNIPFVGTGSVDCRRAFDKVKNMSVLMNEFQIKLYILIT